MDHSAAHSKAASTVTYLQKMDLQKMERPAKQTDVPPIRYPWTEELERRRRAVARWRGSDIGIKETMLRE